MILSDLLIRTELKNFLLNRKYKPRAIIDELRVHNGNAIADLVTIHSKMHCYEIKSDLDSLYRLADQARMYAMTFPFVTVVVSRKHLDGVIKVIPSSCGILCAEFRNGKIKFQYIRKAELNKEINMVGALKMFWRDELCQIYYQIKNLEPKKSYTRDRLILELSDILIPSKYFSISSDIIERRNYNKSLQTYVM